MKKPINNYSNYLIYDNGDVYNSMTGKMLKGSIGENGYKYYRLSKDGNKKMLYAHRLVAEHFIDNPQNLPVVNHIDGNKLNNNIDNLEWASYSKNTQEWHNNSTVKREKTQKYTEDLPGEEWKPVKECANYLVSNCGRVRNVVTNNLLKPSITCGYYKIVMSQEGLRHDYMVHKLVYSTFADDYNIDKTQVIDHIDGNKLNNKYSNLRKVSLSENVNAALYETKTNKNCKKVAQYDMNGKFIQEFPSAREAARVLNLDGSVISKVCRGDKYKSHGGFIFKYI